MMLRTLRLAVLACSVINVTSVSHRVIASWIGSLPPCSSYHVMPSRRGGRAATVSLNAVQDKILEGLRMRWEKKDDGQAVNGFNGDGNRPPSSSSEQRVPFVIQRIGRGKKSEIEEITQMCIDVFFNEQKDAKASVEEGSNKKKVAPWKAVQLAYLRNVQEGGILAQNAFNKDKSVDLIIARRVYPVEDVTKINGSRANIIEDASQIYNLEQLPNGGSTYATGEIIGYCEVSEKNFGLGGNFNSSKRKKAGPGEKPRPYLSNLSVVEYARQSGVGSKLLDATEEAVRNWKTEHTEIVLQVEEDNQDAIQWYKRRGWEFVFADPTCRRYDASGFFLRETRITKYAMVKWLDDEPAVKANGSGGEGSNGDSGSSLIQKLRKSFFVQ